MPAVSANKPGIGAATYRNTGTYIAPTWVAQNSILNVNAAMAWDLVEAGSRLTRSKLMQKARTDLTFQIVMRADDAATDYLAFRAAANSATAVLDLLVLDGLISVEGVHGWRAEVVVSLTGQPQEADGSIYDTFDCRPTWTANAAGPSTVIMGASSVPAFTAI